MKPFCELLNDYWFQITLAQPNLSNNINRNNIFPIKCKYMLRLALSIQWSLKHKQYEVINSVFDMVRIFHKIHQDFYCHLLFVTIFLPEKLKNTKGTWNERCWWNKENVIRITNLISFKYFSIFLVEVLLSRVAAGCKFLQ